MFKMLVTVLVGLLHITQVAGVVINITIDDGSTDPNSGEMIQYSSPMAWTVQGTCETCGASPDPLQAHLGTWHIGGDNPGLNDTSTMASMQFYGFAVSVYCIVPPTTASNVTPSNVHFLIDNRLAGTFTSSPTTSFQYNALAFSYYSVSSANYTLTIQLTDGSDPFFLDYIIYSYDDVQRSSLPSPSGLPPSSSSSSDQNSKLGIIGGVLGAMVFSLGVCVAFLLCRIRQQRGHVFGNCFSRPSPQSLVRSGPEPEESRLSFNPSLLVKRVPTRESRVSTHTTAPAQKFHIQAHLPLKEFIVTSSDIPSPGLDAIPEDNLPLAFPLADAWLRGDDLETRPDHSLDISSSSESVVPITRIPGQRLYFVTNK